MRKYLIFLIGIVSFLGINTVKADTLSLSNYGDFFDEQIEFYLSHKTEFNNIISYWEKNFSTNFPYYYINLHIFNDKNYAIYLLCSDTNSTYWFYDELFTNASGYYNDVFRPLHGVILDETGSYTEFKDVTGWNSDAYLNSAYSIPLINNGFIYNNDIIRYKNNSIDFDIIKFNTFTSSFYNLTINEFEVKENDLLPSYLSLYNETYSPINNTYTEINLNNYSYVALSLKDYNTIPENNYSVYSNIFVKGQLCITPVYNYGMTERKDVLIGTQIQRCSTYYDDFTSTRMYLLKSDVENHSIYYLKSYDTSKDNIIKVDSSVFDISYITEENKDNPYVNIGGKQYPTISYDKLTDTATKSEDEDYISGVTCPVGDFNCYEENNSNNIFTDFFDKPLEMLKSVWGAIISIFELIAQFIALLPSTMQGFLYIAFGISIVLGIIKILL